MASKRLIKRDHSGEGGGIVRTVNAQHVLGHLLFAVGAVLAFGQVFAIFTMPEHCMLPGFREEYLVSSSIENFSFAIPAMILGRFLLRVRGRLWLWCAVIVGGAGSWLFVVHELWLHYFTLPAEYPDFYDRPYFSGTLWWELLRLSYHIMLPAAFVLAIALLSRRASCRPRSRD